MSLSINPLFQSVLSGFRLSVVLSDLSELSTLSAPATLAAKPGVSPRSAGCCPSKEEMKSRRWGHFQLRLMNAGLMQARHIVSQGFQLRIRETFDNGAHHGAVVVGPLTGAKCFQLQQGVFGVLTAQSRESGRAIALP